MFIALLILTLLGSAGCYLLCANTQTKNPAQQNISTTLIEQYLPQTQCRECGYSGCRPYAEAIVSGAADINCCPPGGQYTLYELANLTGRLPKPLIKPSPPKQVAWIDPNQCIGCVKCIPACPVDAIIGAKQQLHGVIPAYCTGCGLCLNPCPVDCIELVPQT